MPDPKLFREFIAKWDGHIPGPGYDAHGNELFSSKVRRAVAAFARQKAEETQNPAVAQANRERRERLTAEEKAQLTAKHEQDFWHEAPSVLNTMGLLPQEIHAIAGLQDTQAVVKVREWWLGQKLFLVLGGPVRKGKTVAAASCLAECYEWFECESVRFKKWRPTLGLFVKASEIARLSYYGKETQDRLEKLRLTRLLVVDDIGAELASSGFAATFTELMDERMRRNLRTILTTNLGEKTVDEARGEKRFSDVVGTRVMARIRECGEFFAVRECSLEGET